MFRGGWTSDHRTIFRLPGVQIPSLTSSASILWHNSAFSPHGYVDSMRRDKQRIGEDADYVYTHTEKGIFSPSPYKDRLLPLWRFRDTSVARSSASEIWEVFLEYERDDDFVGMDNARKFLQMGMTRAKRYANHKGGRKYTTETEATDRKELGSADRQQKTQIEVKADEDFDGRKQKEEASQIFREAWERAKTWDGYVARKDAFLKKQKEQRGRQKIARRKAGSNKRGEQRPQDGAD